MRQTHGIPALLSLFFPGLGQLVKGHWPHAVLVWVILFGPVVIMGYLVAPGLSERPTMDEILLAMMGSPLMPLWWLLYLIVWLWSIVDAYRHPI